jgi:hypothetical protein
MVIITDSYSNDPKQISSGTMESEINPEWPLEFFPNHSYLANIFGIHRRIILLGLNKLILTQNERPCRS